ncbi:MAG: hypothetical protein ACRDQH_00850, partial [Pseudonocardiaceae bacterium]
CRAAAAVSMIRHRRTAAVDAVTPHLPCGPTTAHLRLRVMVAVAVLLFLPVGDAPRLVSRA